MIQRTEREVMNNEIAIMLKDGKPYREIADEFGVSIPTIYERAQKMGLSSRQRNIGIAEQGQAVRGSTLEEIRKANPYKVGNKVIVKDKNGSDTYKNYKCTVEKITDHIVFARGGNKRMYTASFAAIGMDSNLIRKVG